MYLYINIEKECGLKNIQSTQTTRNHNKRNTYALLRLGKTSLDRDNSDLQSFS